MKHTLTLVAALLLATLAALHVVDALVQKPTTALAIGTLEIPPVKEKPCFQGSYYRKCVSSPDEWIGIEGRVVLPEFKFDEARPRKDRLGQFLDNFSVYMGGRAGMQEIDAGLTGDIVKLPDGTESKDRRAFRPFWRNKKWFTAPLDPDLFFWPGDTVKMAITTPGKDKLNLKIELVNRGEVGKRERAKYPAAVKGTARPAGVLSVDFDAPGFGPGNKQEFKRVNAIDQFFQEGKPVDATKAKAIGGKWLECWLIRDGGNRRVFDSSRFTDMRCPDARFFKIEAGQQGGEAIDIYGSGQ